MWDGSNCPHSSARARNAARPRLVIGVARRGQRRLIAAARSAQMRIAPAHRASQRPPVCRSRHFTELRAVPRGIGVAWHIGIDLGGYRSSPAPSASAYHQSQTPVLRRRGSASASGQQSAPGDIRPMAAQRARRHHHHARGSATRLGTPPGCAAPSQCAYPWSAP